MKRILFVDDQPRVLHGLRRMLRPLAKTWDMAFVDSGSEALQRMEQEPIDVLVTDMRMPGMDGGALLAEACERFPNVVRFVLSGHTELEAALRAIPIAHQFMSKPCDSARLKVAIERACELQELITSDAVRTAVGGITQLPARPRVFSELSKAMANPNASLGDVAAIIEQDIAISSKVLHLANSAFFSPPRPISEVRMAVVRLGTSMLQSLVLSIEVFREFEGNDLGGFSIEELHDHAMQSAALAARLLAGTEDAKDVYTAALLHDAGKLLLARGLPEAFGEAHRQARSTGRPYRELEGEIVGVTHAEIGGYLLGLWGLPYPIVEAVANHHAPDRCAGRGLDMATAVLVASLASHELRATAQGDEPPGALSGDLLESLGIDMTPEDVLALA